MEPYFKQKLRKHFITVYWVSQILTSSYWHLINCSIYHGQYILGLILNYSSIWQSPPSSSFWWWLVVEPFTCLWRHKHLPYVLRHITTLYHERCTVRTIIIKNVGVISRTIAHMDLSTEHIATIFYFLNDFHAVRRNGVIFLCWFEGDSQVRPSPSARAPIALTKPLRWRNIAQWFALSSPSPPACIMEE